MNKKAEDGGGFWLFLIFLALIPMCNHAGETSYDDCKEECVEIHFEKVSGWNITTEYYQNNITVSKKDVDRFCYNECKSSVTNPLNDTKIKD